MEPTQPDAGIPVVPENHHAPAEQGRSHVGAVNPIENNLPGPVLAYVRAPVAAAPDAKHRSVWARRLMLIIFVVFCMEVGIMLAVLPWKQIWTTNPLVLRYPGLRAFLGNNFVRGIFSGLGLVDLWIGIWEAVHYSEE
jgi:hypothetical protein